MVSLTDEQINKLSDLCMHIAEGLLITAFATTLITKSDVVTLIKSFGIGMSFVYASLSMLTLKGK